MLIYQPYWFKKNERKDFKSLCQVFLSLIYFHKPNLVVTFGFVRLPSIYLGTTYAIINKNCRSNPATLKIKRNRSKSSTVGKDTY